MRSTASSSQRGFTLIEVMTASVLLSIFIIGIGAFWITADRRANQLMLRQQAIFVADAEMERLSALYDRTSFGWAGPATTTSYDGLSGFPATRLTYPTNLSFYMSGSGNDYTTTSSATFQSGSLFQVWVNSQVVSAANRTYVWINRPQNVMARLSWITTNVTASQCVVGGGDCRCLNYFGFGGTQCQRLDLYLEYPYRLVSGSPVAPSNLQTVTLSTIVGRRT